MSASPVAKGLRPRVRLPKAKPNIMGGARRPAGTTVSTAVTTPKPAVLPVATEPPKEIKSSPVPPPVRRILDVEISKPVLISNHPSSSPQQSELTDHDNSTSTEPSDLQLASSVTIDDCSADTCIKGILLTTSPNMEKSPQKTAIVASNVIKKVRKPSARSSNENRNKDEVGRIRPKKGQLPPERAKMTMFDLIYWNPESNPMTYEEEHHTSLPSKEANTSVLPTENAERLAEEAVDDPELIAEAEAEDHAKENDAENTEELMPVPQVKIGPDGNIILDEQSMVIATTASKIDTSSSPVVYSQQNNTTYASFRKNKATKTWSDKETAKFYVALSAVGTDFSIMANLFPKRQRKELKLKFKREERYNRELVDRAIRDSQQYDLSIFDESEEESENQSEKLVESLKKSRRKSTSGQGRKNKAENNGQNSCGTQQRQRKNPRGRKCMMQEEDDSDYEEGNESYNPEVTDVLTEPMENPQRNLCDQEVVEDLVVESTTETTDNLTEENVLEKENSDDAEMLEGVLKQTRCGRQPKKRAVFTIINKEPKKRARRTKPDDSVNVLTPTDGGKTYTNAIVTPQDVSGDVCQGESLMEACNSTQSETTSFTSLLHNIDNVKSRKSDLEETICSNNMTAGGTEENERDQDEENCQEYKILEGVLKQTRSGRQPKMKSVFTIDNSRSRKETGLLNQTASPAKVIHGNLPLANPLQDTSSSELYLLAEKPAKDGSQVVHLYMKSPPVQVSPVHTVESPTVPDHDYVLQNMENMPINI